MANAPKRKKLTKVEPEELVQSKQKFYCCCCGIAYGKQKGNFSVSHSPMYYGTKYLAICIECADTMFHSYRRELGDSRKAMRRMCMKLDLYWSHTLADAVESRPNVNSYVRSYISKTNMHNYLGKTYDDTIREDEGGTAARSVMPSVPKVVPQQEQAVKQEEIEVPEELKRFWGPGHSPQQYLELEERKNYLTSKYPPDYEFELGEEILLRQISALELEINRDAAAGASTDKNRNLLNTLIGSANLKPTKQKGEGGDSDLEGMPLGVGIQKWEMERPLPPTPEDLKDANGLVKKIHTWFFGHTSKMVGLKNSYCKLYEEAMEELRVNPELEDEDDDVILTDFLSGNKIGGDDETEEPS